MEHNSFNKRRDISSYTPYFPHIPYTVGVNFEPRVPHGIADFMVRRPQYGNGIVKLYKEDIVVLPDRRLKVVNPTLKGKTGLILFKFLDSPDSQDTKTMWTAFAILKNVNTTDCNRLIRTCKFPYLMYMTRTGLLVDYSGPTDVRSLRSAIAGCGGMPC